MQVIGGFRPGASQLLAPLLSTTTRGATSIDLAHRVVHATYLLDSATTGSRTCARIVVHFPSGRGAHGTLTTLGGTASSRRLHLTAAFGVTPDLSHTRATLAGTLHATRGRARGLTKPCLALAPRKR